MTDRSFQESSGGSDIGNIPPQLPSLGFTSQDDHAFGYDAVSPPTSPPTTSTHSGYARLHADTIHEEGEHERDIADGASSGLGIETPLSTPALSRRVTIQAEPTFTPAQPSPSISSPGIYSPQYAANPLYGSIAQDTPDLSRERFSPRDQGEYEAFKRGILKSTSRDAASLLSRDDYQQYIDESDTVRLRKTGAPSIRSAYETDFRPTQECPTARDFYISRFSWLSMTIIILSLFSTVFSGIFLILAIKGPRYGRRISSQGSFKPADAIILTTIFAKMIELSFVTSFVAFLGQVLSRRAFMKEQGRGVTLSELSMWRWVVQPGTLITHWETAKYAGLTVLGVLSLLNTFLATFYGTAASALVQPVLALGKWDKTTFSGDIQTDYANVTYIKSICQTPIRTDGEARGSTCLQIEHAGQGYHNYQRYLAYWDQAATSGNGSTDQHKRPPGFGLLFENTTITAQWINVVNTPEVSKQYKRAINNVSLAFPHSGVFQAARDKRNNIIQPEELDSEGSYFIRASVPSPVMNVLCANMKEDELTPIVYQKWNGENVNGTTWITQRNDATTTNNTVVDDLFGWTKKDPARQDYPPVFAKLPRPFNTIMNHTHQGFGRDAIYLLGQGGNDTGSTLQGIYVLCKIHVTLSPKCSTRYGVGGISGTMESHCEDDEDDVAFDKVYPDVKEERPIPNWLDVGFDWSNSLSLNTGIDDADASNSRLLTQLILQPKDSSGEVDLNPALPSVGEALAVMSGCTLLKSAQGAPFIEQFNYTNLQDPPVTQYFTARLQAQQYASGGTDATAKAWLPVLLLVFLMNCFVLIYFLLHRGLVTDFSEPPNLFALSLNSPPSHLLAGSCGGGPEGKQYRVNWFVNTEGDHLYMEPGEKPLLGGNVHFHPHAPAKHRGGAGGGGGFFGSVKGAFERLRERGLHIGSSKNQQRLRPISVADYEMDHQHPESGLSPSAIPYGSGGLDQSSSDSRFRQQYAKLAKRRSML